MEQQKIYATMAHLNSSDKARADKLKAQIEFNQEEIARLKREIDFYNTQLMKVVGHQLKEEYSFKNHWIVGDIVREVNYGYTYVLDNNLNLIALTPIEDTPMYENYIESEAE